MENKAIEVGLINHFFGKTKVLDNITLSIPEGKIFGLLGSNAAGKSTLSKIMIGELKPTSGKINYYNKSLFSHKKEILPSLALVPQEEYFYKTFSVFENLLLCGSLYNSDSKHNKEYAKHLIDWLNLSKFKDKPAGKLSGGYRRLLNMACSLMHNPKIIFLDEPTVGLDAKMRRIFWKKLLFLKSQGKTIILTTHYMDEAEFLCDNIALLSQGKLLEIGSPKEIIAFYKSKDLEEAFLKVLEKNEVNMNV